MTMSGNTTDRRIEEVARAAYDRCHPDDTFAALKHRSRFSKEDEGLLRQWLDFARAEVDAVAAVRTGFGPQP